MYVACSTLCFGRQPLEDALRIISELGFNRYDVAIHERGPHLKPTEVAADVVHAANRLRIGPGLMPVAFNVDIEASSEAEHHHLFRSICRLARVSAVPTITVGAARAGSNVAAEVERLKKLVVLGENEGVQVTVSTLTGTLTECPDAAENLCEQVPGLGLTLDPSHYVTGPSQGKSYDHLMQYVKHLWLRDTGRGPNQFQVRVGQGEIEYGRIISQLERHHYDRALAIDIRDIPDAAFPMEPEVRKLKYLLESLV